MDEVCYLNMTSAPVELHIDPSPSDAYMYVSTPCPIYTDGTEHREQGGVYLKDIKASALLLNFVRTSVSTEEGEHSEPFS